MLNKNYDFAIEKANIFINNSSDLIFLFCYKFDRDERFDKEAARGEELLNIFSVTGIKQQKCSGSL